MDDRLGVCIDAAPSGKRIKSADGTLPRFQKCPSDRVPVEQRAEGRLLVLSVFEAAVTKRVPIEFGTTVDKSGNAAKDQIAAKTFAVEYGPVEPEPRCGGERARWGYRIVVARQRPQRNCS